MSRARKGSVSNKKLVVLILVVMTVVFLIFSAAKGKYQFPFSSMLTQTVVAPLQNGAMYITMGFRNMTAGIWEAATVYQQNKMLLSEVEQLRNQKVQADELLAENQRLAAMLAYKQSAVQFDLVTARVIARDPGNWTKSITINCGSSDGIQKDMTVVTARGLVGNVSSVTGSTAVVQLILDPRSAVGALVQRPESRVAGIVEGNVSRADLAKMVNIPRDADIQPGDVIITSGFGGIYPKGLLIGEVKSVTNEEGGLLKYAEIQTAVDFNKLEEVFVIVASRQAPVQIVPQQQGPPAAAQPGGVK